MEVILSVEALRPPLTGIGRYTWEIAKRLNRATDLNRRFYLNGQWIAPASINEAHHVNLQPTAKWLSYLPRSTKKWYLQHVGRNAVFHGPNYFVPAWAENSIATIHDLSVFKFPETHPIERVKQFERLFTESVNKARTLITDSEAVRLELIDFLACDPAKVQAIPLGTSEIYRPYSELEWQALMQATGLGFKQYALCVSTLEPRKNINLLLQAYYLLPIKLRQSKPLVLIGSAGWAGDDLKQSIANAVAEGWLLHLGFVKEELLPYYFAGACAFVYPSKYEGFGLPIIEAIASGTAVIANDIPVLREVSMNQAQFINPENIIEFSNRLESCLEDSLWQNDILHHTETFKAYYSWDRCYAATRDLYKTHSLT